MRGYCGIGIYYPKTEYNIGTLWRSAYQLGADFIYTIGTHLPTEASDTTKTYRHLPYFRYRDWEHFLDSRPYDCPLVGVEMGGRDIRNFAHPNSALYLLGREDNGLPEKCVEICQHIISLPSVRVPSYNVAVAGALVLYDRYAKSESTGILENA